MHLFEAQTPISLRVRVPRRRWALIVSLKHPVMEGREHDVRDVLERPHEIRRSRTDDNVLLFYRSERPTRWLCAVVKRVHEHDAFLITAYPTDAIKEGHTIWTA